MNAYTAIQPAISHSICHSTEVSVILPDRLEGVREAVATEKVSSVTWSRDLTEDPNSNYSHSIIVEGLFAGHAFRLRLQAAKA